MRKEGFIDRAVDFVFSKDNRKYVILLVIFGILIRILIALRIPFYADEMGYATQSIGFIESGKLQTFNQDAVWFFLTNLFMKIFGVNVFGLRFLSILFGGLSIILIYLIGKEIFGRRIGLIAAILLTISSYHLINTIGNMDVPMTFFVFLSLYSLIIFSKTNKKIFFLIAWSSLGIAIMIKQIAVLFAPIFALFLLYDNKIYRKKFKISQLIWAGLIVILAVFPILTHNYLLYKDKGLVDMQFSRFTGIAKEQYASIAATLNPFSFKTLFISHHGDIPGILIALRFLYSTESIFILLLAILGAVLLARYRNRFKWLLFLSFLLPFLFLAGTSLLPNHFVFCSYFSAIFAAIGIAHIERKFHSKDARKLIVGIMILLVAIHSAVQIYQEAHGFYGKNEIGQMIDFKEKQMEKSSLVVVDSRIYRGRIAFMFWDRHYLETNFFPSLIQNLDKFPGELIPIRVYFVEAATDDSGWGYIKDQPEFNKSTEQIVSFFKENSQLIKTVMDTKGQEHFRVYSGYLKLKRGVLEFADSTHEFFFYPLEYKPKSRVFDNYETYNSFDSLLNRIAYLILYLEVILALFSALAVFYLLYKNS